VIVLTLVVIRYHKPLSKTLQVCNFVYAQQLSGQFHDWSVQFPILHERGAIQAYGSAHGICADDKAHDAPCFPDAQGRRMKTISKLVPAHPSIWFRLPAPVSATMAPLAQPAL
jgi:hypothetical protein